MIIISMMTGENKGGAQKSEARRVGPELWDPGVGAEEEAEVGWGRGGGRGGEGGTWAKNCLGRLPEEGEVDNVFGHFFQPGRRERGERAT